MQSWLWFNFCATILLFSVTLVFLVRRARREHRLTPELALYIATLGLGWMEAVIDWAAFVYYAPDWPHFPVDWPIVRLIPILPLHIALCYTWFFFGGAWIAMRCSRALMSRYPKLHRAPTLLLSGFAVGFLLDFAVENFFISVGGLWTYTQTWGPLTWHAGADNQWPVYMGFAMALTIAPITFLLGTRNDRGEDLVQVAVRRLGDARPRRASAVAPAGLAMAAAGGGASPAVLDGSSTRDAAAAGARPRTRRRGWLWHLVGWLLVVHVVYGTISLGYAVLRWTGVQTSVSTVKPYPNGPALYDGDVTKPGDPDLNRTPIDKAR